MLSVSIRSDGVFDSSTLRLGQAIAITPRGCTSAPISATTDSLTVFGQSFKLNSFIELDGAISLVANDLTIDDLKLVNLFKLGASRASFLLVAAAVAGAEKDKGFLDLDSGRFEGEIRSRADQAGVDRLIACRLLRFEIEAGQRPRPKKDDPGWDGISRRHGQLHERQFDLLAETCPCQPIESPLQGYPRHHPPGAPA